MQHRRKREAGSRSRWDFDGRIGPASALAALWLSIIAAHAQVPVRFSLDWRWEGPAAPFAVALDKGYFKAEGLDVTIDPAAGSREPISRVASGDLRCGFRRREFAGAIP